MSHKTKLCVVADSRKATFIKNHIEFEADVMSLHVMEFSELNQVNVVGQDEFSIILVCIENLTDLGEFRCNYSIGSQERIVFLIDASNKMIRRKLKGKKLCYVTGQEMDTIRGIINTISNNVISLNCNDILRLSTDSEIICRSCAGQKEVILYTIVSVWRYSKQMKCCLVNLSGDVSLSDVNDICSLITPLSDGVLLFGCNYNEYEQTSVFTMWKFIGGREEEKDEEIVV